MRIVIIKQYKKKLIAIVKKIKDKDKVCKILG